MAALREAGALLTPGLTAEELGQLEAQLDIEFCADHADFLGLAVPLGEGWIDWRGAPEPIARRLRQPREGLLFDVLHNDFWPASWGGRPVEPLIAEQEAREQLGRWPQLVPLYGHRYLPSRPIASPAPVFSVVQSDVIYYGYDLLEWVRREFFGVQLPVARPDRPTVRNWSKLAEGRQDRDL